MFPLFFRRLGRALAKSNETRIDVGFHGVQRQLPPHTEHLPERFGLFTIIVLGEAIIAVVNGVSEVEWTWMNGLTTVFGFVMAFCLWWLYFENVSGTALNQLRSSGKLFWAQVWLYVHLPLVIGLAAAGVGVEQMIDQPGCRGAADPGTLADLRLCRTVLSGAVYSAPFRHYLLLQSPHQAPLSDCDDFAGTCDRRCVAVADYGDGTDCANQHCAGDAGYLPREGRYPLTQLGE